MSKKTQIGCDLIELTRIEEAYTKHGDKFVKRILTPAEIEQFESYNKRMTYLAGRFAAKEAISKAYKIGICKFLSWQDMTVLNNRIGAPSATVRRKDYNNEEVIHEEEVEISISHSKGQAMAVCIINVDEEKLYPIK